MPIYKGDVVTVNGEVVSGEKATGDEISFPNKVGNSITASGVRYVFNRMENGEAVYRKENAPAKKPPKAEKSKREHKPDTTPTMARSDLPNGAILRNDYVGGTLHFQGRRYRMMQPITKCEGEYIYLPA